MPGEDDARSQSPGERQDPYAVLGVGRGASTAEIIRAFRALARGYHPDLHPGDAEAAGRFRRLAAAYQMLADPARRAAWDRAHPAPVPGARAGPPHATGPPAGPTRIAVHIGPWHPRRPDPPLRAGPVYHTPPSR